MQRRGGGGIGGGPPIKNVGAIFIFYFYSVQGVGGAAARGYRGGGGLKIIGVQFYFYFFIVLLCARGKGSHHGRKATYLWTLSVWGGPPPMTLRTPEVYFLFFLHTLMERHIERCTPWHLALSVTRILNMHDIWEQVLSVLAPNIIC